MNYTNMLTQAVVELNQAKGYHETQAFTEAVADAVCYVSYVNEHIDIHTTDPVLKNAERDLGIWMARYAKVSNVTKGNLSAAISMLQSIIDNIKGN